MNKKIQEQPFDFEKGMQRLEEIIVRFDEGSLTLDEMESFYVEGMELIQRCSARLNGVETRVAQLMNASEGKWTEKSFGDEPEE